MKRLNIILITSVLAVVFLIVEVVIVKNVSRYEPLISVVYSTEKIPARTVLTEEMIKEKQVSLSTAHKQSYRSKSDIVGKKTSADIESDEMILSSRMASENDMEEIQVKDKNNRLFSVEFKADQANGWWLMVDQSVDIIYVETEKQKALIQGPQQIANVQVTAKVVNPDTGEGILTPDQKSTIKRLNNIRVAAIIDDKGKLLKNSDRQTLPKYISFEVTKEQDEILAFAKTNGRLELSVIPNK